MRCYLWLAAIAGPALALQGCLARTTFDVATAPVKVVSKGVDLATTSQAEADLNRGRDLRRREEKLGKLQRKYDKQNKACVNGDDRGCEAARTTYNQIQVLLPTVPLQPKR